VPRSPWTAGDAPKPRSVTPRVLVLPAGTSVGARRHAAAHSPLVFVHQPAHLCVQGRGFERAGGRACVLAFDRTPGGKQLRRRQRSGRRVVTTITMPATASRCSRSRFVA